MQHRTYCNNWLKNIKERKQQAKNLGFLDDLSYNYDQPNADINEYNNECAF